MTNSMLCAIVRTMDARRPIIRRVREVRADENIDPAPKHAIRIRPREIHDVRAHRRFNIRDTRSETFRLCSLHVQHIGVGDQCARPWTGGEQVLPAVAAVPVSLPMLAPKLKLGETPAGISPTSRSKSTLTSTVTEKECCWDRSQLGCRLEAQANKAKSDEGWDADLGHCRYNTSLP